MVSAAWKAEEVVWELGAHWKKEVEAVAQVFGPIEEMVRCFSETMVHCATCDR